MLERWLPQGHMLVHSGGHYSIDSEGFGMSAKGVWKCKCNAGHL